MFFRNRRDAGNQLAEKLTVNQPENTVVLALPRGGVPLAIEISKRHSIPFDVVHAKKIVHPLQREFAIGAIAEKGEPILNTEVDVEQTWIDQEIHRVREEIARRRDLYDTFLEQEPLEEKEIILVDDGIATGMTMFAAIEAIKNQQPNKITVAVPIIPEDTYNHLKTLVDDIIYIEVPEQFLGAVGAYYQQFPQISDEEIPTMIKQLKN
ncbi:Predicted phosphoribosyltransferase [Atopostipes suicloacalis DSM 15692]|uniref:Predicted phosphoribosyltransferase n=1 Tax=Atopostipes suicloacalis DSM 15692 TaxID=1121025 RepID=A0A1M4YPT4_9LACT|nr:phosphoribosyltransferase family protein [Atopostipes suicloacalis]SHF07804.1 Predicted phosphoribosyltransferase [Atopostipes suicloacalis DSM 15692]